MDTSASSIFSLLENCTSLRRERRVFWQNEFNILRRCLASISYELQDSEDESGESISRLARTCLRPWLSVPRPFDTSLLMEIKEIDKFGLSSGRWGSDIRSLYTKAIDAARCLQGTTNPLSIALINIFREIYSSKNSYRIYCRSDEKLWFYSIFEEVAGSSLYDHIFVHSAAQYRRMEPVDTIIRVGPLRSAGYACIPDAILSAPRFNTILQFVWSGCHDESDFGFDPGSPNSSEENALEDRIKRVVITIDLGRESDDSSSSASQEELPDEFISANKEQGSRPALLVIIPGNQGVLYRLRQQILSFDPTDGQIKHKTPFETLQEDMFIIRPEYDEVDLGSIYNEGEYARTWKLKLHNECKTLTKELADRLFKRGLIQKDLPGSIKRWCSSLGLVLPAPGDQKHFNIMLQVLELYDVGNSKSQTWHHRAWEEIRRARGEAIKTGRQEMELIEEELKVILNLLLIEIRQKTDESDSFTLSIPDGKELSGRFRFYKVLSIEDGFQLPDDKLDTIQELSTIQQWRD